VVSARSSSTLCSVAAERLPLPQRMVPVRIWCRWPVGGDLICATLWRPLIKWKPRAAQPGRTSLYARWDNGPLSAGGSAVKARVRWA
jgi:hypothetical protein